MKSAEKLVNALLKEEGGLPVQSAPTIDRTFDDGSDGGETGVDLNGPGNSPTRMTVTFATGEDADYFLKMVERIKAQEGTLPALWCGILCSSLRNATIR